MGDSLATIYGGGDTAVTIVDTASTQLQLAFPNLRPSIKDFTHNDGAQQRLACLYGTIPTRPQTSNGPVYNIPVDVWLPTRLDSTNTQTLLACFLRPCTVTQASRWVGEAQTPPALHAATCLALPRSIQTFPALHAPDPTSPLTTPTVGVSLTESAPAISCKHKPMNNPIPRLHALIRLCPTALSFTAIPICPFFHCDSYKWRRRGRQIGEWVCVLRCVCVCKKAIAQLLLV